MKKTLLTLLILIVALAVAYLAYAYFFTSATTAPADTAEKQEGRTFNPFGLFDREENIPASTDAEQPETIDEGGLLAPRRQLLTEVSSEPVAGVTSGAIAGEEMFRYVDRATAHISDFYATSSKTSRIANTTIPRIQKVVWGNVETLALFYLDDDKSSVVTFVAEIVPQTGTSTDDVGELLGTFFPLNISQLVFNGSGNEVLYTREDGGVFITRSSIENTSSQNIFSSTVEEWLLEWGRQQTATLTTKPSRSALGHMFLLNTNSGTQTHILRDIPGLTTNTSHTAENILYAGSNDAFALHIYNTNDRTTLDSGLATLPEKCVLGTAVVYCAVPQTLPGNLPDSWYQGRVSFSDVLWKIDIETGFVEFVFSPQTFDKTFDMIHLTLTPSESHVAFINKSDGSLWVYDLREEVVVVSGEEGVSDSSSE